ILDVRAAVPYSIEPLRVVLVVREERLATSFRIEMAGPKPVLEGKVAERFGSAVISHEADVAGPLIAFAQNGLGLRLLAPDPGVPEPEMGQQVDGGVVRPSVLHGDANHDVLGTRLRVFHEH